LKSQEPGVRCQGLAVYSLDNFLSYMSIAEKPLIETVSLIGSIDYT